MLTLCSRALLVGLVLAALWIGEAKGARGDRKGLGYCVPPESMDDLKSQINFRERKISTLQTEVDSLKGKVLSLSSAEAELEFTRKGLQAEQLAQKLLSVEIAELKSRLQDVTDAKELATSNMHRYYDQIHKLKGNVADLKDLKTVVAVLRLRFH